MRHAVVASTSFVVSLLLLLDGNPVIASHQGTEVMYFQASTRGTDFDGDGRLEWCWTQYHHGSYGNALDEVPQTGTTSCPSISTEKVDVMAYGWTSWSSCTSPSSSCPTLRMNGIDGVYADGCDFIEGNLYDYAAGYWKGKQRMIHARDAYGPWSLVLRTANNVLYLNWWEIGFVVPDGNCQGGAGWTNYHIHHDFQQPGSNCHVSVNSLGTINRGWEKQNSGHWIHGLVHQFTHAC
jgi:hypothetical protein